MSLSNDDIQKIQQLVNEGVKSSMNKHILKKPHMLDMTYDELGKELEENIANYKSNIRIVTVLE